MRNIIIGAFTNNGLKLGSVAAYESLANSLLQFPLDWSRLKEITIVGASLSEPRYEMVMKFEQNGVAGSTRTIRLNDVEMRIE